ncbi:MAG: flippase-like domain-containing protein [Anaerolineales bacterium]|nr:flippase-like domain-containing protein [Anaerolineales bacterium]
MKDLHRKLAAGLVLGFLVLLGLALLGDIRQVGSHLASFNWSLLPWILAGTIFNYSLRQVKWHYYLRLIGVDKISWLESARLFVAGFPLPVTPGKVGEALKGIWVNRVSGMPVARAIPVIFAERISDGLAVLVLSTLGVIAYPRYWPAFTLVFALLMGGIIIVQIRPLSLALLHLVGRLPLLNRIAPQLLEFYEGTYALFRPIPTFIAVGLGTIAWTGEGFAMYLVLRGLGIPGGWETFSLAVFTLSFSTIVGAASTLPGGVGAAEASIVGMLRLLLNVSGSVASAATLMIRFATLWFGVGLGLLVWLFSRDLLFLEADNG